MTGNPPAAGRRNVVTALNEIFAAVAGWSFDHRWWVLIGCVGLAVGSAAFATRARIDNSYEAYFDPSDSTFLSYEKYRDDFGSDEASYILYEAPDFEHGPWNLAVMHRIAELTSALEDEVPFIYEVTSLANAELIEGAPDGIDIHKLEDDFPPTQAALLALREKYLAKPMMVGGILSADARYGALIIEMDRSSTDPLEEIRLDPEGGDGLANLYPQVTHEAIEEILARPAYEGIRFYRSGDVPMNDAYNRIIGSESMWLNLMTLAVVTGLR